MDRWGKANALQVFSPSFLALATSCRSSGGGWNVAVIGMVTSCSFTESVKTNICSFIHIIPRFLPPLPFAGVPNTVGSGIANSISVLVLGNMRKDLLAPYSTMDLGIRFSTFSSESAGCVAMLYSFMICDQVWSWRKISFFAFNKVSKLFNLIYVRLYLVQCREVIVNVLFEFSAYVFL